jgi:uncharacterized protein with ParB-like and HNH nuclease domain
MKANEVTLNTFLSQTKTQFIIPVYQRNYDWTEAQCQQLFDDIVNIGHRPRDTHFIGSIVFIHDGVYTSSDVKQLVVIDGQQRLTTISLLYMALYHFSLRNNLEEKAVEIKETYLLNKFVREENSKLKLKQSDTNAKAFSYILNGNDPANYQDFSRIIENYSFFHNNISNDNIEPILNGLNNLLFVEISLERGKDDPQRIFESLNSTGLELSQADLIRNYLLMGLEPSEQNRIFTQYWDIIEQNAKDGDKEESQVSEFIRDYLTYRTKKIPNKGKVYAEFKSRFRERNKRFYEETLAEIKSFSFHYSKLLTPTKENDPAIRKQLEYINQLEMNISYPFLMPVYNDYINQIIQTDEFESILKLIQSYSWRRIICGLPTSALSKIFMSLYGDVVKEDYVESIQRALIKKKGTHRFPNNKEIEIALEEKDVYNIQYKNRMYFFELLENFNNREYVSVQNPNITIEHIFPQTPNEAWYNRLDEKSMALMKDKYLNTISNLTLSGNNGSLSNNYFTEKKLMNVDGKQQGYKFSRLWLNQFLQEVDKWDIETLKKRYNLLLTRFYNIWEFPEILIDEEVDTDQDYYIYNSPDPRFKKLDYFIFRDEKIETDEVSKMYYHVISQLFEETPSAFYHKDIKELLNLTGNKNELRAPYPINASNYIESNIDNVSKFRRLKSLLNKLDLEEDLLINFSDLEPDEIEIEIADRSYWIAKAPKESLEIVDQCLTEMNAFDTELTLNYIQRYIGISKKGKVNNFVIFVPRQNFVWTTIRINNIEYWVEELSINNFKVLSIGKKRKRLKFRITCENIQNNRMVLSNLLKVAHTEWMN